MDKIEIIKDAFLFPSKNIKIFLIFVVLSVLAGAFSTVGTVVYVLGFINPECFLWGGMAVILAMVIGWVLLGYLINVIKSGIDLDDEVPVFKWWDNFTTGFDSFIVSIVYYIIPAFIVAVVGYLTNIIGNTIAVFMAIFSQVQNLLMGASTTIVFGPIAQALVNLAISLAVTITVALIVFVIFSFIQSIAQARLANTGSLKEALNFVETVKDIARIGILRVIIVLLLVIIIIGVINLVLSIISGYVPILSILSIIVTPYLIIFTQRAVGLLYSDIA